MPGRTSQYTAAQNDEMRGRVLVALADAGRPMTSEEIINADITLAGVSTQKISKLLNELIERGVVSKNKSKLRNNRMVYMTVETFNNMMGK